MKKVELSDLPAVEYLNGEPYDLPAGKYLIGKHYDPVARHD